jgi:hypothetical protein
MTIKNRSDGHHRNDRHRAVLKQAHLKGAGKAKLLFLCGRSGLFRFFELAACSGREVGNSAANFEVAVVATTLGTHGTFAFEG